MIPIKRLSPLALGYRITSLRPPQPELVLIVRAKLRLRPGEPLVLHGTPLDRFADPAVAGAEARAKLDEAALIAGQGSLTGDRFEPGDDGGVGQVVYPSDFAEFKPRADVMVRGSCYARGGGATERMVGFGVGAFYKELRIVGPRAWIDKVLGGKATEPLRFTKTPVDYNHAFGGPEIAENPTGTGHANERLPCVEDPKRPIVRSTATPEPAGFAPLNSSWGLRRGKIGKAYDDEWRRTRAPWVSADYDWTAQNAAPEDQQLEHFLRGDESVRFVGLHETADDFKVELPGIVPRVFALIEGNQGGVEVGLVLDTLFADLEEGLLYLTWRGHTTVREDDLSDVKFILFAHETGGKREPKEHYLAALDAFAADPYGLKDNPATELAALEGKLASGELDRELDALGPKEDPITKIFGPMAEKFPGGRDLVAELRENLGRLADKGGSGARDALKSGLKEALGAAFAGPSAPRLVFTAKGEVVAKPLVRRMMRDLSAATKQAGKGADPAELRELVQKQVMALDVPGISDDDLVVPENFDPPAPAPGADFTGCDLAGDDFRGLDLEGACFDGANIRAVSFRGANLRRASFRGATLVGCDLTDASLEDAQLLQIYLTKCVLRGTRFAGATLDQAMLQRCDLRTAALSRAKAETMQIHNSDLREVVANDVNFVKNIINECSAQKAHFQRASLPRTVFRACKLEGARFDQADISNGAFIDSDLSGARLWRARAESCNFQNTKLEDASFKHAELGSSMFLTALAARADFSAANLPRARFYRAVLREARFEQANLLEADMRKAVLSHANLRGANCFQAVFIEAHGEAVDFRQARLGRAIFERSHMVKRT